ncbi:GerAB/ArcD/ProY family transporter [Clostridium arbusti]|uniref:GerAB/ArcD/ProY family transporter n=1 Tax=Clostridium arbusti TaxID=1137848 RepID=UPI00028957F4|nr:GerAB/ArcD/ProY family transporter [Clostridium arbusti]
MKEKITSYQFLAIMFLVPYGSAGLFFLTPETKNDVWIALLFYAVVSIIIQMIYISLFNKYPKDSIVQYLPKVYGKFIGFILSIAYIGYFVYNAGRNLRDFTELIEVFSLTRAPRYVIEIIFMLVITYAVYKGIENIGSMAQMGVVIIISSTILIIVLLLISKGCVEFANLLPILHQGFINVVLKGWKLSMFPYGEFIAMTMLYPVLIEKTRLKKTVIFTSILEGTFLALNNMLFIVALGYKFARVNNYPLLETLRLVHIGDFLNRLDIIFVVVLMLGGFFKISILIYVSALGISQVFKTKKWGAICSILGIIVIIISDVIAKTYPEHIYTGWHFVLTYISLPVVVIIPVMTLIVYYLKKLIKA